MMNHQGIEPSMSEENSQLAGKEQRNTLGYALLFGGLITTTSLIGYIVYVQKPHFLVIAATLISWFVFVVGKTMVKSRG